MQLGRIAVVGDGGLLGEIMAAALSRHGEVISASDVEALASAPGPAPDVIAVWCGAAGIGWTRTTLRRSLPPPFNPLLVFLSQHDPHIYFTRLRDLHVDRRRLGFHDVFDAIAGQLAAGAVMTAPAQTRPA